MAWDDDLVENSNGALETLVSTPSPIFTSTRKYSPISQIRVGMSVGHHPDHEAYTPDMKKENPNPTQEEMKDAERRIGGGKDDTAVTKPHIAQ